MPELYGKYACSSRGSVIPMKKLAAEYIIGTNQRGIRPHTFNFACGWTNFVPQPLGSITRHRSHFQAGLC